MSKLCLCLCLKAFGPSFYRIVVIDVRARREGRELETVGFYDPINNKSHLNVPASLDFLEQGAQPTPTVSDILENDGIFAQLQTRREIRRALNQLSETQIDLLLKRLFENKEILLKYIQIKNNRKAWARIYEIVSRAFNENA